MHLSFRQMIDLPPIWLAVMVVLAVALDRWLTPGAPPGLVRALGYLTLGSGLAVMIAALIQFPRHDTTVIPHQEPRRLITAGVYRLSRNPIYLADALILTGLCLIWGAWAGLLLVPLFVWIIERRFIRGEEARLAAAFGPDFEAWASRTRRWL